MKKNDFPEIPLPLMLMILALCWYVFYDITGSVWESIFMLAGAIIFGEILAPRLLKLINKYLDKKKA